MLDFDPTTRLTAQTALAHPLFSSVTDSTLENCFESLRGGTEYPHRRISQEDNDMRAVVSAPGSKRSAVVQEDSLRPAKRYKEG